LKFETKKGNGKNEKEGSGCLGLYSDGIRVPHAIDAVDLSYTWTEMMVEVVDVARPIRAGMENPLLFSFPIRSHRVCIRTNERAQTERTHHW